MDIKEHTKPENLLKYAFYYNEIRLVVAAISLIAGGAPVAYRLAPALISSGGGLMSLAWLLSGVSAGYLLYLYIKGGKKLWGKTDDKMDLAAFWIAIISGLHLGFAGLTGMNIGMTVIPSVMLGIVMLLAGLLYLFSAAYLFKKYKENPNIFGKSAPQPAPVGPPPAEQTPE